MRIDESRVFVFQFDTTQMGGVTFPLRAESREEAAEELQKVLARIQTELAMEFPKVAKPINSGSEGQGIPVGKSDGENNAPSGVPFDVLEMRIDTLMSDLGAKDLTLEAKTKTIEDWTGKLYATQNYADIIKELELIASGQKDIQPKGKKK